MKIEVYNMRLAGWTPDIWSLKLCAKAYFYSLPTISSGQVEANINTKVSVHEYWNRNVWPSRIFPFSCCALIIVYIFYDANTTVPMEYLPPI